MTNQKEARYQRLYDQLVPLLKSSPSRISQMATINAILYHKLGSVFWIGFYMLESDRLTVGPYQGPLACQELSLGKGACWHTIHKESPVIIPNVNEFPGHIACDSRSKSEIVLPLFDTDRKLVGVLDIDSDKLNAFDKIDQIELSKILTLVDKK